MGDGGYLSILAQNNRVRNRGDVIRFVHRPVGVQGDPCLDWSFRQELLDGCFVFRRDGDELNRLVLEFFRQVIQMWNGPNARSAPGRPKFQNHDLAAK